MAPELPVTVIEGDQARRNWQWQLADTPIKIANYELLQRDAQALGPGSLRFDLVVLDEAQRIKNRAGHTSQAVRQIGRRRSWALTGTPVENSPEDLVGIFEFLAPGHLTSGMKPRRMGQAASDYILRRTKDKVLTELPPKMFRDAQIELTSQQRATYQMAEEEGVLRLTELGEAATIQHVFELVLRLKQICNFDPATGQSAKLERLSADLEEVAASGRKAIIFSQWVDTLQHLARELAPYRPLEYHGRVPSKDRDDVIERFRDDPTRHVLLISYGAGGVGLNLQFAGYVFLFDRWWNPAVEDQAVNRGSPHRRQRAGHGHAFPDALDDRRADRPDLARQAGAVRHDFLRRRPPSRGPEPERNFWALPSPLSSRPDRHGGVIESGWRRMSPQPPRADRSSRSAGVRFHRFCISRNRQRIVGNARRWKIPDKHLPVVSIPTRLRPQLVRLDGRSL